MAKIYVDVTVQVVYELQCQMKTGIGIIDKRSKRSTTGKLSRQLPAAAGATVSRFSFFCLIHVGLSYGERHVPLTTKTSLNDSVAVRLKWTGHLARMNEDRSCKKVFLAKPMGDRPRDRPPLRWIDCVET
ncbi:hypothetical protein TNCV_3337931 [Trichonephila clavipes]|nr:hypothetical protein TNCV_3337931 [Trichonephila clavipes]